MIRGDYDKGTGDRGGRPPAVGFYRSCGSEIAAEPDPELFALEPNDIHMVRKLQRR